MPRKNKIICILNAELQTMDHNGEWLDICYFNFGIDKIKRSDTKINGIPAWISFKLAKMGRNTSDEFFFEELVVFPNEPEHWVEHFAFREYKYFCKVEAFVRKIMFKDWVSHPTEDYKLPSSMLEQYPICSLNDFGEIRLLMSLQPLHYTEPFNFYDSNLFSNEEVIKMIEKN